MGIVFKNFIKIGDYRRKGYKTRYDISESTIQLTSLDDGGDNKVQLIIIRNEDHHGAVAKLDQGQTDQIAICTAKNSSKNVMAKVTQSVLEKLEASDSDFFVKVLGNIINKQSTDKNRDATAQTAFVKATQNAQMSMCQQLLLKLDANKMGEMGHSVLRKLEDSDSNVFVRLIANIQNQSTNKNKDVIAQSCFVNASPESQRSMCQQFLMKLDVNDLHAFVSATFAQYSQTLQETDLSIRAKNALSRMDIATVSELCRNTKNQLLSRGMGLTTLSEICEKLAQLGLSLRKE
jgi:hypothetical protein